MPKDRFDEITRLRVDYHREGFSVGDFYSDSEFTFLRDFAVDWLHSLFEPWLQAETQAFPLSQYHEWGGQMAIDHDAVFRQKNRYRVPPKNTLEIILNDKVNAFLSEIDCAGYSVWDEGIGGLGFRMVRPNHGDGYPMTRKAWGTAPKVISIWIPIVGMAPDQTICLVPGSHLREFDRYMPEDSRYVREFRLANAPADLEPVRPEMAVGKAIVYHPKTLHTEEVEGGNVTRLNLELRVLSRSAR